MKHSSLRLTALLAISSLSGIALCSWDGIADSVHFYSKDRWYYEGEGGAGRSRHFLDFGRAPQPWMVPGWNNEMQRGAGSYSDFHWEERRQEEHARTARRIATTQHARNLETAGHFAESARAYESLGSTSELKSFVRDRRELARHLSGRPSGATALYLQATYLNIFGENEGERAKKILKGIQDAPDFLRPHLAYVMASEQDTAEAYLDVAAKHPRHPRALAAKMMAVRQLLSANDASAEQISLAKQMLPSLLTSGSPYRWSALGWAARIDYLAGNYDQALQGYFRQLELAETDGQLRNVYGSISLCYEHQGLIDRQIVALLKQRELFTSSDRTEYGPIETRGDYDRAESANVIRRLFPKMNAGRRTAFNDRLKRDQDVLAEYLAHRIEDTQLSLNDEQNLTNFALDLAANFRSPKAKLAARISQLCFNTGQFERARRWSERGIKGAGTSEDHGRAAYVHATALARTGHISQGSRELWTLAHSSAPRYLRQAAQEARATMEEGRGNFVEALRSYHAIHYRGDAAFLADAKMTPGQLSQFIATLPRSERPVYQFTLGMRYLRIGDYRQSRRAFSRLSRDQRLHAGMTAKEFQGEAGWFGDEGYPKGVDPLQTVSDLERLAQGAKTGRTANERAQALYDQASYIYKRKHLLFYSLGLWQGQRMILTDLFWSDTFNGPQDEKAFSRHQDEHECLAHTMRLCGEVIAKYPHSPIRVKALYTGALASQQLSHLNTKWRVRGELPSRRSVKWMSLLVKEYPQHPLAKDAAKYAKIWAES